MLITLGQSGWPDAQGARKFGRRQKLKDPFKLLHKSASSYASLGLAPAHHNPDDISSRQADSEAEALADPSGMAPASQDSSKGIWIEPGSNKGFDSYALDSLQVARRVLHYTTLHHVVILHNIL
jgi:hypothetical protein